MFEAFRKTSPIYKLLMLFWLVFMICGLASGVAFYYLLAFGCSMAAFFESSMKK